jgi:hypothetical protein
MILNEFFNLPQVFEKDMEEGTRERLSNRHDKIRKEKGLPDPKEYLKIAQQKKKEIADLKAQDKKDPGMEEGMFGSRPSPVLPIVDKIAKVARELTPQNVEVGKQIIQNKASEITRMLSPRAKAGVDVIEQGVAEGSQQVDSLVIDALKIMRGSELNDAVAALKTVLGDREYNSRRGYYNFYVRQLMDMSGQQGMAEGSGMYGDEEVSWEKGGRRAPTGAFRNPAKSDYVPPKEADYSPEYQAMVRRVGQKARAQEKAKQQPPKAPVRESRLALLKQIIQS